MQRASERVLLVDSSVDEREMYADYLQLLGFCTLQADNAKDGYRLASEMSPEVVITAMRLAGGEDGLALTQRLKATQIPGAAVILMSSSPADRYRDLAAPVRCDRFIMKPCLPDRLAAVVQELLLRGMRPPLTPSSQTAAGHRH